MINTSSADLAGNDDGWEWGEAQRFCLRLAYRYASNRNEAEDIAQDALLRAWRRRSTLREPEYRSQWLASIVRNEAFRQHAKVRPSPTEIIDQDGEEDAQVVALVELADLREAVARLSDREREVLEMRYEDDLTQRAIAEKMGIPEGTVKVRLHRARKKLRRVVVPR